MINYPRICPIKMGGTNVTSQSSETFKNVGEMSKAASSSGSDS